VGALVAGLTPALGAESGREAAGFRARAGTLAGREHAALLELYAAESRLARARAELAGLQSRLTAVEGEAASVARRHRVLRSSLRASQQRVARLLKTLYVEGDTNVVAVLLGATSLDEALLGVDGLRRAAARNSRLASEAEERSGTLRLLAVQLRERRSELAAAASAAAAGAEALERETAARAATVAGIRQEAQVARERLSELEALARTAERTSERIAAEFAPAPLADEPVAAEPAEVAAPPAAATGPRELVVDAVAYHLPGVTASGIPVGPGVIAVDPAVIPLGTQVFVPGYGPAVAADTGSAIKGNVIDLWMPSTADARAWGRRTVTIAIYG
jgi:3D (Asp-Asp-Asp) domain-containing protein/predicted  nucleic acid-binding Zn-ribbon protein